jgi:hypothetical protein
MKYVYEDVRTKVKVSSSAPLRAWSLSYASDALKKLLTVDLGKCRSFY